MKDLVKNMPDLRAENGKELRMYEAELTERDAKTRGCLEPEHWGVVKGILYEFDYDAIVVDLGISSQWEYIASRVNRCRNYIAVELADYVWKKVKKEKDDCRRIDSYHKAHFIKADARRLPLCSYIANVVLICGLLDQLIGKESSNPYNWDQNKDSVENVIRYSNRLLTDGGVLVASNDTRKQPVDEFKKLAKRFFEKVEIILGKEKRYLTICRKPK